MKLKSTFFVFILVALGVQTIGQVNLNNGLVMYLPFNGNANDASGNGNNGVVNGATLTTDQAGNPNSAYLFDGIDDDIVIPASTSNGGATSFSVCLKVSPEYYFNGPCFGNSMFSKGTNNTVGAIDFQFNPNNFYGNSCNHPFDDSHQIFTSWIGLSAVNTRNTIGLPQQNYIDTNQWYCLIYTLDATTGSHKLYVDGTLHVDTTLNNINAINTVSDIYLGHLDNTQFPYWLKGKLDEVRMYDRALNAQEVQAYCNNCVTTPDFTFVQNCNIVSFTDNSVVNCSSIVQWLWDFGDGNTGTGSNTSHTYPNTTTSYPVTLTLLDINADTLGTVTKNVSVMTAPVVDAGPDATICAGNSIQLNASSTIANTLYTWLPPSSSTLSNTSIENPIASPVTTTTYRVVGIDDVTGCSDTDDVVITVLDANLNITASPSGITCPEDTVQLELTPSGFSSYNWTPSTLVSPNNTAIVNAFADTTTLYIVEVQDLNGCTYRDSILVEKFDAPEPTINYALLSCSDYQFVASNTGGTVTSWDWDFGDGTTDVGISPVHTYTSNGTFVVTLTANYGTNCSVTVYDTIAVDAIVNVQAEPDTTICPGDQIQLRASGAKNFTWINNTLGLNNTSIADPLASPSITTTYTVVGNFSSGCTDTATVTVTVRNENVDISGPSRLCLGEGGEYSATANVGVSSYSWSPASIMSNPGGIPTIAVPNTLGSLFISVAAQSASGCTLRDTQYVQVERLPDFGIKIPGGVLCKNTPIVLEGTGGGDYSWEPSIRFDNPFLATTTYTADESGIVSVSITGMCKDTVLEATIDLINEEVETLAQIIDTGMSCINSKVELLAEGGVYNTWSPRELVEAPNKPYTIAYIDQETSIYSDIVDEYGCHHYDTLEVEFEDRTARFFMPNVFRIGTAQEPYKIMSEYYFNLIEFSIYDRWGKEVFTTSDINEGWDGYYKSSSEPIVNENYVWVIKGSTLCGPFQEQGTVLLLQ